MHTLWIRSGWKCIKIQRVSFVRETRQIRRPRAENPDCSSSTGLFMRGAGPSRTRIFNTRSNVPNKFVRSFPTESVRKKKPRGIRSEPFLFPFSQHGYPVTIFSSTVNLFIAYRFCRCSIHLSSRSAKLSHKYCDRGTPHTHVRRPITRRVRHGRKQQVAIIGLERTCLQTGGHVENIIYALR